MALVAEAHTRTAVARQDHREAVVVVVAAAAELAGAVGAEVRQQEGRTAAEDRRPLDLGRKPMRERDRHCSLVGRRRWGSSQRLEQR